MKGRGVESSNKCEYNFLKTKKKLCVRERDFFVLLFFCLLLFFFFPFFLPSFEYYLCIIRLQKVKEREREKVVQKIHSKKTTNKKRGKKGKKI